MTTTEPALQVPAIDQTFGPSPEPPVAQTRQRRVLCLCRALRRPKHRVELGDPRDTSSSSSNDDPSLENRLRPLEDVVGNDTEECDDDHEDTDEKDGEDVGEDGRWDFLRFILNSRVLKRLDLGFFFEFCLE